MQPRAVDEVLGSLALTQPLATGGRLGLQLQAGYGRARFEADIAGPGGESSPAASGYAPSLQLSFQQPLLRGSGADVARADRRRARIERDLAGAEREGVVMALVRDIVSDYWELVYAARELTIRHASAAAAREQLERVQANIAVGKLPPSASAEIEVAIALRDEAVFAAQQALIERSLALGVQCGLPVGEGVVATDALPGNDTVPARAPLTQRSLETALAQSPQLQALRARRQAKTVEIDVTESGLLPQLDFTVAGGRVGTASLPSPVDDPLTGTAGYVVTAGLTFALPIGSHSARGARDAAREGLRQAQLGESEIAAQLAAGLVGASARCDTARRRAEVLEPSVQAAALDLEAEKARFEVGRASNFDVLRRQDQLAAVQLLSLRARVDELDALAALDALMGEILERNGVVLEGAGP